MLIREVVFYQSEEEIDLLPLQKTIYFINNQIRKENEKDFYCKRRARP
jgi:hypothetical protein